MKVESTQNFNTSEVLYLRTERIDSRAVDLGLPSGTLWEKYNVGASKAEEYGDHYAWGETEIKTSYTSDIASGTMCLIHRLRAKV